MFVIAFAIFMVVAASFIMLIWCSMIVLAAMFSKNYRQRIAQEQIRARRHHRAMHYVRIWQRGTSMDKP